MHEPTLDKFPKKVLASVTMERAFIVSRLVVAAERLQVFRLLEKALPAKAVARALDIHPAYLNTFLNSLVALGLLRRRDEMYSNTRLAEKYFVRERSVHWTRQYSKECVEGYDALTVLEEALASGKSCKSIKGLNKVTYTEAMRRDPQRAKDFTQMLFHYHRDDAEALAKCLDLSKMRSLLDVGGGSGVMSIALARRNPHLHACVFDIAPVCKAASKNIRSAGMSKRITTLAGDIRQPFPEGHDVIMFCDIGPVSPELLRNAYESLPANGLTVLVDRYLNRERTQPLDRVISQFISGSFPQATSAEMVQVLRACGFARVRATKVYRDLCCITGSRRRSF